MTRIRSREEIQEHSESADEEHQLRVSTPRPESNRAAQVYSLVGGRGAARLRHGAGSPFGQIQSPRRLYSI